MAATPPPFFILPRAPQGLQNSAQGFNPGNPQNRRFALKGRERRLADESTILVETCYNRPPDATSQPKGDVVIDF
jgi:hypothetical protein